MKTISSIKCLVLVLFLGMCAMTGKAAPLGTAFVYQGFLSVTGSPADGKFDMTFTLFQPGDETPGPSVAIDGVDVSRGLFTVRLDFGPGVFGDTAYELAIGVRQSTNGFSDLKPRQRLAATPEALHARTVSFVPDTALSPNVALLNGSPIFNNGITANTMLLRDAAGGGLLRFGGSPATNDSSIAVSPAGPSGLLLRDPAGIRILPPGVADRPTLRFGPTDDCTVGTDPALPGLVLRDRRGIRLLNPGPGASNMFLFGPTDNTRISADPNSGMSFSEPRGFTFSSQMTVNGPIFAQAFIQTSSRRFKEDVKPIEEPLEKIAKLKGVRFTWKEEKGGRPDIGFIAEDVSEVIPEVVAWEEDGQNARGVNYDHLVAVAIEGIKAQQTQIQALEREKAELKQSLDAVQSKLDRLSQQLEKLMAQQ